MAKTEIVYTDDRSNPEKKWVHSVQIDYLRNPFSVYRCYSSHEATSNHEGMIILPVEAARRLFDFKEGDLKKQAKR